MIGDFIHSLRPGDLPETVRHAARLQTLDTLGVGAAATRTTLSRIIREHAARQFAAGADGAAALWLDGRRVSPAGAALANGMTIDAVDAHDGWRPSKGHAGCHVVPAALAMAEAAGGIDADELLTLIVLGYEVGLRVAVAQHATVADYHASGSWGAVGVAALGARLLGLDPEQTRDALGIAEYHGPRSQMLRVTTTPTMLKDSSGWGAMTGVSATYLARDGFTGAPAITVEGDDAAPFWQDLGTRWLMTEQYIKPYPTCRWSHAPVAGALALKAAHGIDHRDIARIEVATFAEALTLDTPRPQNTEQAQYSLPFPVAVALVTGDVAPGDVDGARLHDPEVLALVDRVVIVEDPALSATFPAKREARVSFVMRDGTRLDGQVAEPLGDPERPMGEDAIRAKFHAYADPVMGPERATALERAVDAMGRGAGASSAALTDAIAAPEAEGAPRAAE